ncbi:hypothetical protein CAL7716_102610 (plasmid) [Calothrix sp. PCC 7716]|nr:hypothetical protein CAL7716_102610 [Calothrix sp. PCC 7716]
MSLPSIEEFRLILADGSLTESEVNKWLHVVVKNTEPCSDIKKQYLAIVGMNPNIGLAAYRYCLNMAPVCIDNPARDLMMLESPDLVKNSKMHC